MDVRWLLTSETVGAEHSVFGITVLLQGRSTTSIVTRTPKSSSTSFRARNRARRQRRCRARPGRGRLRSEERLPRVREHRRRARIHDLGIRGCGQSRGGWLHPLRRRPPGGVATHLSRSQEIAPPPHGTIGACARRRYGRAVLGGDHASATNRRHRPLLPTMQESLQTTHAVAGLLGTIPVLCMGLFAPPAAYLGARVEREPRLRSRSAHRGIRGRTGHCSERSACRSLDMADRRRDGPRRCPGPRGGQGELPLRPAGPTGVYTTGVQVGSALSAAIAVPIALWYGGWRTSLIVFSLVTIAMAGVWLLSRATRQPTSGPGAPASAPLAQPHRLVAGRDLLVDGVHVLRHQRLAPDSYVERGWGETAAGSLLAILNLVAIPAALIVPWLSDRVGTRRRWLSR